MVPTTEALRTRYEQTVEMWIQVALPMQHLLNDKSGLTYPLAAGSNAFALDLSLLNLSRHRP